MVALPRAPHGDGSRRTDEAPEPGEPRLRVMVVAESYLPYLSGVTVSTEALVRGLGSRGHRVLLVAPRPAPGAELGTTGAIGPDPEIAWLPSYQLPRPVPAGYRMPWPTLGDGALRRALAFGPDVVHTQSPFVAGRFARRVAWRARAPLVFTQHTRYADYRHYLSAFAGVGGAMVGHYLDRFARRCDAVIAPSTDLADEMRARLGDGRPIIRPVPTGIDVERIAALDATDHRSQHGWPSDAVVAVTAGRLAPEKSVDTLLEGFALAAAREARLRLVVVGDGSSADASRQRVDAAGLSDRVAFLGQLPRLQALSAVKGGDVFMFASRTETQGLVLVEALACGVPVLAVAAPGVGDSVTDGVDAVVVTGESDAERAGALAMALADLAADPERLATMGRAGAEGAARFSVAVRLGQVEDVYREALGTLLR